MAAPERVPAGAGGLGCSAGDGNAGDGRRFAASKAYGVANIAEISAAAAEAEGWPAGELLTYLRENIDFTLDAENLAGLELYYCLAAKLGLIPQAKSVEWASGEHAAGMAKSS